MWPVCASLLTHYSALLPECSNNRNLYIWIPCVHTRHELSANGFFMWKYYHLYVQVTTPKKKRKVAFYKPKLPLASVLQDRALRSHRLLLQKLNDRLSPLWKLSWHHKLSICFITLPPLKLKLIIFSKNRHSIVTLVWKKIISTFYVFSVNSISA